MSTYFRALTVFLLVLSLLGAVPAAAKTLRLAMDAEPVSMDPHAHLSTGTLQFSHLVFDPLLRWTQAMDFEPRLAHKWERIDDRTLRFHLRKGVTFHSGNPLTAGDVEWTLQRLKRSESFKGIFEPVAGTKIIDDHTIDLITKSSYPLLLNVATYIFPMDRLFYSGVDDLGKPKDAIEKFEPSFARDNASGTGPFRVTERVPGTRMIFERIASYWDTQSPGNVSRIELSAIGNASDRVNALLAGKMDMIMPVAPQDYEQVRLVDDVRLVTTATPRIILLQLNQDRRPEFREVLVRQAIVHAIDNRAIVDAVMRGAATAAGQQAPKGYAGHMEGLKPRFNLKRAQKMMQKAGYPDGFECTMIAPNNRYINDEKIAATVVSMLAKINIRVKLTTMDKARYWEQFDARQGDIQMIGWHPDTEDSANYSEYLTMCPNKTTGYGKDNSGSYCNPIVDDLVLRSQSELDPAKRGTMLQRVEQLLYDDAAFVPLHWQNISWAAWKSVDLEPIVNALNNPYFGDLVMH
ncbi:MAG: ABC transporter substrate-binding protein [Desulfobacterales bacterium]|jgi:peptide/nickel transport system substrate-binding protein